MSAIVDPDDIIKIPTRAEHKAAVRRIWKNCIIVGLSVIATMTSIVFSMMLAGFSHNLIVAFTTVLFQVIIAGVFTGFTTPYFLETRVNMNIGMDMSRRVMEISNETARNLGGMEKRLEPMVKRGEEVLAKLERMVSSDGEGGAKLDRMLAALEKLASRVDTQAGDAVEDLLRDAWKEDPPGPTC